MITRLLHRFRREATENATPYVPAGQRVYCIGDIHGRLDLLEQIHDKILRDVAAYDGKKTIVYLGDYIDRGSQSKQVLDLLLSGPLSGFDPVHLMGNHEQVMMGFIEQPEASASWLSFGGREALYSYGIPLAHIPGRHEVRALAEQLDSRLPDAHRHFLQNCAPSWCCGDYYFVHAGIQPGIPTAKTVGR